MCAIFHNHNKCISKYIRSPPRIELISDESFNLQIYVSSMIVNLLVICIFISISRNRKRQAEKRGDSLRKSLENFGKVFYGIVCNSSPFRKLKIGIDFKTMVWKLLDYEQGADAF